jgi:hypothetical protein
LADLLLDLAADLFDLTFGRQATIVRHLPDFFFNAAFHCVKRSLRFVIRSFSYRWNVLSRLCRIVRLRCQQEASSKGKRLKKSPWPHISRLRFSSINSCRAQR